MSIQSLLKNRFIKGTGELNNVQVIQISGKDAQGFLQGQLTNDINKLNEQTFHLSARLDRSGKVIAFFYLVKDKDSFFALVPNQLAEKLIEDLEKFIIMEDVVINTTSYEVFFYVGPNLSQVREEGDFSGWIYGEKGLIRFKPFNNSFYKLEKEDIRKLSLINGFPEIDVTVFTGELINYTRLNDLAIDYQKGCFLGQETAAKLNSRRDVVYFPVVIESNNELNTPIELTKDGKKVGKAFRSVYHNENYYIEAQLHRDYRMESQKVNFDQVQGKVFNYPLLGKRTDKSKAEDLFHYAVDAFNKNDDHIAISLLDDALELYPLADAYESKGVILGRNGEYEKAISLMDKLLEVDPNSVMAHTNKSLYLMKMGKIEEAESEKDKATVKSFKRASDEAKEKKEKEQAIKRREEMFQKVLELDSEDLLACYGMAEIYFGRDQYQQTIEMTEQIIRNHPKHSQSYLLKSKAFVALNNRNEAVEILEAGIQVAKNKGDLKPLQEMNSLLQELK
ncbi:MAG: tetratricopeptide repeat protein [Bacteriovoracaceae bacterium]